MSFAVIKAGAELGDKGCRGRDEGASAIPAAWLHAYAYLSDDEQKITAVSSWVSREACDAWRASWEERAGAQRLLRTS